MEMLNGFIGTFVATLRDVVPIALVILFFQIVVIRKPFPNLRKICVGFFYGMVGLVLFLEGLEMSLFPLGKLMALQLTDPTFIKGTVNEAAGVLGWKDYKWVYLFAAAVGFSTTLAEPALIAVAIEARKVSGGVVSVWGLRIAVAVGVAIGVALGTFRIVTGTPLYYYIIAGYIIVVIQTIYAPKVIIPLAYDSGGVTTSTVTVPLVAALGLGLASTVPGRSTLIDGFGLIAFASLFPIITVMGYAQLSILGGKTVSKKEELGK
ncbi:MAG: DUF1538 domain-containing protein [Gammaproteobacteria bacterium]